MEKKKNTKHHHNKHGKTHHKALDAYALYELEHKPHTPVEVPSVYPSPQYPEKHRHNRFEKRRTDQQFGIDSLDHGDGNGLYYENIDDEAGEFLAEEHHKFKESKLMSLGSAYEGDNSYKFTNDSVTDDSDWSSMYNRPNQWSRYPEY